ncbi:MAG: HAMP domain-containing sensor histidine kinase [Gemmatimonadota bacterium]
MWKISLPSGGGSGPSLVLLLLCSLILSGVLAYQAQDAARSHRAASESALRDYAALASDELSRQLRGDLEDLAEEVRYASADAERRRSPSSRLEEFAEEMLEEVGPCDCPQLLHDYFVLDLRENTVDFRESSLPPEMHAWIEETVRRRALMQGGTPAEGTGSEPDRQPQPAGGRRDLPEGLGHADLPGFLGASLLYSLTPGGDGNGSRAYGLVIDGSEFAAATAQAIMADATLLPPSLTRGLPEDEMLSMTLTSGGDRLFQTGGQPELNTEVVDTLEAALGTYVLHLAVRPDMADRLVIGGLPRSRLPFLVGIFLLTLGLSAIAIIQLRRQQALVRLRSGFVASVSHELRTPLAQIRLFSDLLGSGRLREEQRARSVRIIGEEAQRLAYLVENVLRFSRAEQRLGQLSAEPTDFASLTSEIIEGFAPLAQTRRASIEPVLESGAVASVDRGAVRQVLLNLLDNAVKYGPPGQTIRVGVGRDGAQVRLWVDDEGPGIPPVDRASVWQPYHRLQRDVEAATGGSGIGLAVVRDLVAMHGGAVAVEGAPGGGARFVTWFPAEPRRPLLRPSRRAAAGEVPV